MKLAHAAQISDLGLVVVALGDPWPPGSGQFSKPRGRGRCKDRLLPLSSYLPSNQPRSDVRTFIITFINIDPPHHHWRAAGPVQTFLDRLLDPQALGSDVVHLLGTGLAHKRWIEKLTGQIVTKLLSIVNMNFQQLTKRLTNNEIFLNGIDQPNQLSSARRASSGGKTP